MDRIAGLKHMDEMVQLLMYRIHIRELFLVELSNLKGLIICVICKTNCHVICYMKFNRVMNNLFQFPPF